MPPTEAHDMSEAEPFLPEHARKQPEPAKKASTKTVLLWMGIIVGFIVLWQVFNDPQTKAKPRPFCADQDPSIWVAIAPFATLVAVALLLGVFFFWRMYVGSNTFNRDCEPASLASARGDFERAVMHYREVLHRHAKKPSYVALLHYNIGVMLLSAGKHREAIDSFAQVERAGTTLFTSSLRALTCAQLAQAYALMGDLESAAKWSKEGHERLPNVSDQSRLGLVANLHLADAIRLCREGAHTEAIAPLLVHWTTLRSAFTAKQMYVVEVLRAFAETQGGVRAHVSEVSRGGSPKELTMLVASWPDMRAFAATNGWWVEA